ncbi:HD-GYP domain-containing protein [Gracilinema caldarium]|uniref:HD-GYP domain-containing protein n=1 Tax=Gracilinema caldarium TaxID=215591 RepID=UPI0026EE6426|nr:HD-GYP domain-containing protein [Gracilinema caldarium]
MQSYPIKDIPEDSYFDKPVFLDGRFILTAPEMPFTHSLRKALLQWEFREVQSDGIPKAEYSDILNSTDGTANEEKEIEIKSQNDSEQLQQATDFYQKFLLYVENLFTRYATKNDLNFKEIADRVKELCEVIREDRRFLLRVEIHQSKTQNFLANHTVKSTIIAVVIGSYLKLPSHRLIELGVAALLHEIGMLKLPPQLYMSGRPLSPQERKAILTHPILSYNILKSLDFPLSICVGALEHHERQNGEGYPQKLKGDRISLYAKIIAVACSYEALTAQRPYKDAKDGYTGMIDLLKNVGQQYDDTIVRALVYSLSIYPIGLYVLLSNNKKGQVVDVNPENPRYPIVQVFGEKTPDGKNKLIETSQAGIHIIRPLIKEEVETIQE